MAIVILITLGVGIFSTLIMFGGIITVMGGDILCLFRKRIWLKAYNGEIYPSRLGKSSYTYVYPLQRIGEISLLEYGEVTGREYIKKWSYNKKDLI